MNRLYAGKWDRVENVAYGRRCLGTQLVAATKLYVALAALQPQSSVERTHDRLDEPAFSTVLTKLYTRKIEARANVAVVLPWLDMELIAFLLVEA